LASEISPTVTESTREDFEVHYWTKELGVSKEELQKAVNKVGNSAAAVLKELAA
jgi:hypothetical protein